MDIKLELCIEKKPFVLREIRRIGHENRQQKKQQIRLIRSGIQHSIGHLSALIRSMLGQSLILDACRQKDTTHAQCATEGGAGAVRIISSGPELQKDGLLQVWPGGVYDFRVPGGLRSLMFSCAGTCRKSGHAPPPARTMRG